MKAVKASVTRAIPVGSYLTCADNSGAKLIKVISVSNYKGVHRRMPACGVADLIKATVKEGDVKMRKTVVNAVIVRQRAEFRRKDGLHVSFEDNAAVVTDEKGDPKGTEVKGPVAKEAVERFSGIGKISTMVV